MKNQQSNRDDIPDEIAENEDIKHREDKRLQVEIVTDQRLKQEWAKSTSEYFDKCVKQMKICIGKSFVFGLIKVKEERIKKNYQLGSAAIKK